MYSTKVLIADDHFLIRLGLKVLINSFDGYEVVLDVENGKEVLANIHIADLFIIDLEMPVMNGVEVLKKIKKEYPQKKVIILTSYMDISILVSTSKLKPNGFLFKDGMHQEIKNCLYWVQKGNYYRGKKYTTFLNKHQKEVEEVENLLENINVLTKTEIIVLYEISNGLSTSEIALKLFNSPKTIDNHRTNIARKLDVSGYNNLQVLALKHKLLIDNLYIMLR